MPRLARFVAVLALGAALTLAPAGVATAQNLDDFDIESFDADWVLTRDADGHAHLRVTETIVAMFPDFDQNKGFYRDIPEYRHGVQLHTAVDSVVDEFGQPVAYTTEYYYDFFSVGLGDDTFVQGRQTYVISYEQVDVIEAFADTGADEFYWDVNGTGWAQPFGRASMTLTVDPSLVPALTGASDCVRLVGDCDEPLTRVDRPDGSAVFTAAATNLIPTESLTVAIAFEPGTFEPGEIVIPPSDDDDYLPPAEQPTFWDTFGPFILGPAAVVISLIAGATQGADRSRRTGPSDIIIPQYTPPDGLNVMVASYIAGRPERAFAAQIVNLAVRGNVRLLDHPADSSAPFEVELLHADGVDEVELKVLQAVFGDDLPAGRRIPLGSSNTKLGSKLSGVYRMVDKKLKSDGYQGPAKPTFLWSALFFGSVAVAILTGLDTMRRFADDSFAEFSFFALFVAIFSASATYGRRSTVATLSQRGREQNDYLLGMRDYMQLAEEDRIRYLQSPEGAERIDLDDRSAMVKLYERLLPYAIIFGIEDQWSQELTVKAAAAAVPVAWWSGSSDLTSWRLTSTINGIRRSTPEPPRPLVAKAKSSSSGSGWGGWGSGGSSGGWSGSSGSSFSGGSSGGGFSGGGGGGGGGRGR
ncbi:DUF2207 domain-containing protein [Pseudolysinimonas sp.]|jgi:hypothetical protein|uniref:DUF2207 domain-containing protein n=1 Tax=Pseudolysinimonas sp. TaxID=2680009 RepID=UPI00378468FC